MTGAEIKALIADLGISTRMLAAKLDVPAPVVLAWQREELFPTKRHVEAMRALTARATLEEQALSEEERGPAQDDRARGDQEHGPTVGEDGRVGEANRQAERGRVTARGGGVALDGASVLAGLRDPAFWTLIRKLLAYPALRDKVEEAAAKYRDPGEETEESK